MNLTIIGTGSRGNAYALTSNSGETLLIEAGVTFREIKRQLEYNTMNIIGCIITHEHNDHAKSIDQVLMAGIDVFCSYGTMEALGNDMVQPLIANDTKHIGGFMIIPFNVAHDANEPFAFMIYHAEMGWLLFITDTTHLHRKLSGFDHIMIETNYSLEILQKNYDAGEINDYLASRVPRNHLSLENVLSILKKSDLSQLKNLIFIHLSGQNADPEVFRKKTMEQIALKPFIAENQMKLKL